MEQRGIVVEVTDREVIVLTPSGEFRRQPVAGPAPGLGEEIHLADVIPSLRPWWKLWHWSAPAAMALVLLLVLIVGVFQGPETDVVATDTPTGEKVLVADRGLAAPVKYITVDINPSVELGLDGQDLVVTVRPLNEDGGKLLAGQELTGLTAEEAVKNITTAAVRQGYLAPAKENAVVIAVSGENRESVEDKNLEQKLKVSTQKVLKNDNLPTDRIQTVRVPRESRQRAEELGLSVGKFAIFLEALDNGLRVDAQDLRQEPITKVIVAAGGNPAEVITKAANEANLQAKAEKYRDRIDAEIAQANAGGEPTPPGRDNGKQNDKKQEKKEGPEKGNPGVNPAGKVVPAKE
ncbi:MAG: anti-sigma factor domain-containing protein [Heliobacteriaceae bacterium]|nr:anti-sigma factor domain-containing protein [Heliobacteriaceae bacterium]MDD4587106.1 anti-sigma factor domain-containing protein [Heliobacteriaceae bacterium]